MIAEDVFYLMMEQTDSRKCHYNAIFIANLDYIVITNRSARLCDVLNTALVRTLNVVAKWEECIRTNGYTLHAVQPCAFFLTGKYRRFYLESFLPCALFQHIHIFFSDINIDRIVAVCTLDSIHKLKI